MIRGMNECTVKGQVTRALLYIVWDHAMALAIRFFSRHLDSLPKPNCNIKASTCILAGDKDQLIKFIMTLLDKT